MRYRQTFLLIALFAAGSAMAQEASTSTHVSTAFTAPAKTSKVHWFTSASATKTQDDLRPIEGLSPQAWATAVGWSPGVSAFPDAENYSWQLHLVSFGHQPWASATSPVGGP